ncbi:transmembrane protein 208-like isoform X2 [Actinia tenebrosa]|uniref:Transmembrane protein 208 n=1 Tax=Actinia tenebrosa TaxID=6105 RepID=A0A6P8HA83_ACTTE|nr:transmembrane protein 208-like isoform X2 [Actinia tenebrosa]
MAPAKGKQATKGQKQILEENNNTVDFYSKLMIAVEIAYFVFRSTIFSFSASWISWTMFVFATLVYIGCYKFMTSMAKPAYSDTGALIDGGMDLNSESGTAEHVKDLILLTAIVQFLAIFTDYFWFFLLLAPMRAMYMLWTYILGPWFFAEAPEEEVDAKKQKKMERKMKRAGMMQ